MMNATNIRRSFAAARTPALAVKLAKIAEDAGSPFVARALALQARVLKAREAGNMAEAARLSELVGEQLRKCGL